MLRLVHLQFDKEEGNSWFRSSLSEHHLGQLCVAETKDGLTVGKVNAISEVNDSKIASKVKPILREATKDDIKKMEAGIRKERHAVSVFQTHEIGRYRVSFFRKKDHFLFYFSRKSGFCCFSQRFSAGF